MILTHRIFFEFLPGAGATPWGDATSLLVIPYRTPSGLRQSRRLLELSYAEFFENPPGDATSLLVVTWHGAGRPNAAALRLRYGSSHANEETTVTPPATVTYYIPMFRRRRR